MYNFSIPMALMDYVPVLFFGAAAVILLRDLHGQARAGAYALLAAGMINVFAAGFLKATWKLLYAAGVCDFAALNALFLPLQSLGFLLAGAGLIGVVAGMRRSAALAVAPPVFGGSMVFILMMVAGLGAVCACLSVLAARLKKRRIIVFFALSFFASLCMGYMSSRDSTSALVNWIEQGINCVGQGLLLGGVLALHKAGLADMQAK
ncbi:MAG: hypothetical protein J6K32_03480 [Clostridia bacterium]|nr:hypothetical protein [Clostridia bacterium]